jgi:hypothetical protein
MINANNGAFNVRTSSFSNEDPLRNLKVRVKNELYDVPMIRMDDFGILNKSPTVSDTEMKRINQTVEKLKDLKEKYKI